MAAVSAAESGYSHVQGTRPMSLGIGQADSPAGLAAWIVEKFRIASAANLYYETFGMQRLDLKKPVRVPTAIADFPKELTHTPRPWLEARFNPRRHTEMPRGGHFAAAEQPELFPRDVRSFFRELR